MFECGLNCSVYDLTPPEVVIVVSCSVALITLIILYRKWAFNFDKYPETSLYYHAPRLLFVVFALALITIPPIWMMGGFFAGRTWAGMGLPAFSLGVYGAWLYLSDASHHRDDE